MLQATGHTVTPWLMTDIAVLLANEFLHHGDRIIGTDDAGCVLTAKHRDIVEMVASSEDLLAPNAELASDLCKRSALVVTDMAEAGVDIVPYEAQVRNFAAVLVEERLNGIGVLIGLCDQTKRRVIVLVQSGREAFVDPVDEARHVLTHTQEKLGMSELATFIPGVAADVLRGFMAINLALNHH